MATLPNRGVPPAYDYGRQVWMDSADHVHVDEACHLEPMWCGADLVTCQGVGVSA